MDTKVLLRAMLRNQQLMLTFLNKEMIEDREREEDEEEDEDEGKEDKLFSSMVKAIKSTRSPHRTIASNY